MRYVCAEGGAQAAVVHCAVLAGTDTDLNRTPWLSRVILKQVAWVACQEQRRVEHFEQLAQLTDRAPRARIGPPTNTR